MRFGARLQAAIDVLDDIIVNNRPASVSLADWGKSHRFAGAGDRAVIGNLVYDALRKKASLSWLVNSEQARALILATSIFEWGTTAQELNEMFSDDKYAPDNLTEKDIQEIENATLDQAPGWVQADIPEWLEVYFEENFSEDYIIEGQALSERPPTDLRVNSLKSEVEKVQKSLHRFSPESIELTRFGLRLAATKGATRGANILPEAAYQKGWLEVQDAGSQVVSELVYAQPGEQILDFCAGAGGKTLAISALMNNKGQIHSFDIDRTRLAPIYERLKRAGTRNVQVHGSDIESLISLKETMDRVVVDAPCTGSGVWRRRPDTKWRLNEKSLAKRVEEQLVVLEQASEFVKKGGFLCYITCSILPNENEYQVYNFLERNSNFDLLSAGEVWEDLYSHCDLKPWSSDDCTITLTPSATKTDGFFFAVMGRVD